MSKPAFTALSLPKRLLIAQCIDQRIKAPELPNHIPHLCMFRALASSSNGLTMTDAIERTKGV